jgi:polyphosphate kinase
MSSEWWPEADEMPIDAERLPADFAPTLRLDEPRRFLNRELSLLDFVGRILALAEDPSLPILERVKFLAIVSQNLDQFFQVRVAGLKAQVDANVGAPSSDGRTPAEQLRQIREEVLGLVRRKQELFSKEVAPRLAESGIRFCDWEALADSDRAQLSQLFHEQIFPVLTPLLVDPAHPFPYISNLSLNLAVVLRDPTNQTHRFARVKVPSNLPRFFLLPDGERFVPFEQLIAAQLDSLFPGMEIVSHYAFRVTRDADLAVEEEEAGDLLVAIESGLRRRRRMNSVVRLEIDASMSARVRSLLLEELELGPEDVYGVQGTLGLEGLWAVYGFDRPELKDKPWVPVTQPRLSGDSNGDSPPDLFAVLREGDVLVHHPYDSFSTSFERFLAQAAADPAVLAIKLTLYRTSGPENPVLRTLTRAAERGKQVVVLVELKARFDEEANIEWARTLEKAGIHVVYGLVGLKTHAKIALVVRQEAGGIRRYCHVGTGNYNPETSRIYEDLGLLSAAPELGADLTEFFNHLTGFSRPQSYRRLILAPEALRPRILELIRRETMAPDGRIVLKMNSLADPEIIDALYRASQSGVEIDLIVRGICCLRPGVPGLSERIRVRSIVGRFLEHSRLFRFGSEARGPRYFLGSADLMPRNLDRRVEVLVSVQDPDLQQRLEGILSVNLMDDAQAWELGPDGAWSKVATRRGLKTQQRLHELARVRSLLQPDGDHADRGA